MKNIIRIKSKHLTLLAAILVCTNSCTNYRHYLVLPHDQLSAVSSSQSDNKPTVTLKWEFQRNGKSRDSDTEMWAPHVKEVIKNACVFSAVNSSEQSSDYILYVTMDSSGWPPNIRQFALSFLTLGFIFRHLKHSF